MLGLVTITAWHWVAFIACVLVFLALDLGVFHRKAHVVKFREALTWTIIWIILALLFAAALKPARGGKEAVEFLTGYFIELSLSMDNVFVIALIFAHFRVPNEFQHRVLFWGILGALVMRGAMIGMGAALIHTFHWILWVFGVFLVFSGIKMYFARTEAAPEENFVVRLTRKLYPVSTELDGQKFVTVCNGRKALTPLALVLVMVETTDLIFALDSIPAIFAVTNKMFIVFTSNVFAILGLRSLYFVLAGAIEYFRYLKAGLSLVLVFVGVKMLLDPHDREPPLWFQIEIPASFSLMVIAAILITAMVLSVTAARRSQASPKPG